VLTASYAETVYAEFDQFFIMSQEQFIKLRKALNFDIPSSYEINGAPNPVGTAGEALNGKNMKTGGGKWETSGSAKGDFLLTGTNEFFQPVIKRTAVSDTERRKAFVSAPLVEDAIIFMNFDALYIFGGGIEGTGLQREIGLTMHNGAVEFVLKMYYETTAIRIELILKGSHIESQKTITAANGLKYGFFGELTIALGCIGGKAFAWTGDPSSNAPALVGTLTKSEANKMGMFEYHPKASTRELAIYSIAAYESESDVLVNHGRSFDIGTEGTFRQNATEENWGTVPPDEGFYPKLTPGGLEELIMQGLVLPSQGDLDAYDDSGTNKVEVTPFYRPAYHFTSEAI
jgi:hypothetical protein